MTVPGNLSSPLLATAAEAAAVGGVATKSLRFNSGDSAFLSRTPSSAGNRKKFTFSAWVKKTTITDSQRVIFSAYGGTGNAYVSIDFRHDSPRFLGWNGSSVTFEVKASRVLRDPSAWYHIIWAVDTSQSTAANRAKLYINGVEETDFQTSSYPSQNSDLYVNTTNVHKVGENAGTGSAELDAYLADLFFIDGSQLDESSFGAFDSNGVWQAAVYSGTYGTNGFHLDFADSSDLGDDNSGNGNDFTPNNLSGTGAATSSAAVLNLPLNSTPFADSSASSATITNTGSISTTSAATNSFNISTVASLDGSTQRLTTNNNNISFQGSWTVDAYFIIDSGSTAFNALFNSGYGSQTSHYMYIGFDNSNKPYVETSSSGSRTTAANAINKNQWYHMRVIQKSGTITMYINGTSVLTKTAQTTDLSSQGSNTIGSFLDNANNANNFFGQLGPFRIINDALDAPSSGGEATSSGTLANTGTKTVGENIDSLFDVPTNGDQSDTGAGGEVSGNYCTWNPLAKGSNMVLKNGNLDIDTTTGKSAVLGTIGMSSGKWYWETTINGSSDRTMVGIGKQGMDLSDAPGQGDALGWGYYADGGVKRNDGTSSSYGASFDGGGDVIGCAFDADNGTLTFYKNGTSQGTAFTGLTDGPYFPATGDGSGVNNAESSVNFGQRAWAYSAPSNHKALCTTNLPTPTIADGSDYFDTKLWTGTGATRSITGYNFSPDWVWIKKRSGTTSHNLFDIVRGANKPLFSNQNIAELSDGRLTAFNSDGFTLDSDNAVNDNNETHVGWAWDAGSSTVSNTDGSITSNVRANQSAGFSIVSYSGNNTQGATIGHGLNAEPHFVIIKNRDASEAWDIYHKEVGYGKVLRFSTSAAATASDVYPSSHSSSVIKVGNSRSQNGNNEDMIAYCFAPVAGYSVISSFEANGSTDGPFVHLGFRPKFLLIKNATDTTHATSYSWVMIDTDRYPDNRSAGNLNPLYANKSAIENLYGTGSGTATGLALDILSNGFKVRSGNAELNFSGTYIYYAVAENPFQANGGLAR